jgi:hypothetical protein
MMTVAIGATAKAVIAAAEVDMMRVIRLLRARPGGCAGEIVIGSISFLLIRAASARGNGSLWSAAWNSRVQAVRSVHRPVAEAWG